MFYQMSNKCLQAFWYKFQEEINDWDKPEEIEYNQI